MINAVGGATWVSFQHGGGVGIGFSQHAGQVIVADGTPAAARRLERVLTTDPGMGVVRHVDAGYPEALAAARRGGMNAIPSAEAPRVAELWVVSGRGPKRRKDRRTLLRQGSGGRAPWHDTSARGGASALSPAGTA